ncbi:MAG: class I SAM-dependent methyltransferase [Thermodesulfobacteriota bacterium]|nr:class I SAM-dependent methyltransferase [Thermodesulfobacteriota bacterium]
MEIPRVPVHCNLLWKTRDQALSAPKGDIRLAFCRVCGHVFNVAFDPGVMQYSQDYDNSLHFSPRFQQYATSLAKRLVRRHELYDKDIIEIGCGKGDFLVLLCDLGGNRGVGFDKSYVFKNGNRRTRKDIKFVQDFYSDHYAGYRTDMICCRHVLEHIPSPRNFLANIRQIIGSSCPVLFFEVPNVMYTLRDLGIWDVIYEHCSYFSPGSLAYVFTSSGFEVMDLRDAFTGQFLNVETRPTNQLTPSDNPTSHDMEQLARHVGLFKKRFLQKLHACQTKLALMARKKQRAVVWGAGSKGVTFLNAIATCDHIQYVVDINPHKHGKFVPGTAQQIVEPDFLGDYRPDTIIVMNPIYLEEIRRIVKNKNLYPEFVLA